MMLGLVSLDALADNITVQGEVSGQWNTDTVFVAGDITISNGQSLLVNPGTHVLFQGSFVFNIQGSIQALGTANDSICFQAADTAGFSVDTLSDGGWRGIRFDQTRITNPASAFAYCRFSFGKNADADPAQGNGGAICVRAFDAVEIGNCYFADNFARYNGGAISLDSADIAIHDCYFTRNRCGLIVSPWGYGGAVSSDNSSPDIRRNVFSGNSSTGIGGALAVRYKDCDIYNNVFTGNYSGLGGAIGILHIPECTHRINTNLIVANTAEFFGGGVSNNNASPYYINNTIISNTAAYGGGFYCKDSVSPGFYNTIIWGNTAAVGNQGYLFEVYSQAGFFNCDVEGGPSQFGGSGGGEAFFGAFEQCIDEDPRFLGWGDFPYQLDPALSPCVDAGSTDTSGYMLPEYDLAMLPRVWFGAVDIGAFEVVYEGVEEGKWGMIVLYPNPTGGVFSLKSLVVSLQSSVIEIIDIYGKVIETHNNLTIEQLNNGSVNLDISHLPDGVYIIRLYQGANFVTEKLVKVSR